MTALADFFHTLLRQVGGDIRTDETSRVLYSTDASIYQVLPLGVCFPRDADDVSAIVTLADQYDIPLLPRAGGTGLAGQTVNEALVLDFSHHMTAVQEINVEERWARVQPGLIVDRLNAELRPFSLKFGPDPASANRAGLGGVVGNNATGAHSILYGMAADHVLATEVVLSDGTRTTFAPRTPLELNQYAQKNGLEGAIYRKLLDIQQNQAAIVRQGTPRHWRRCGGYNLFRFIDGIPETPYRRRNAGLFNLAQLMTGSEGTLGVLTSIKLNLVPTPRNTALAIVHFDEAYPALDATQVILEVNPSAIELLDKLSMDLCRTQPKFRTLLEQFVVGQPNTVLLTEFYGDSEADLRGKLDQLKAHLHKRGVPFTEIVPLLSPEAQVNVWKVRKAGLGLLLSQRGDFKPIAFVEDTAVPVQHLADHITHLQAFCADLDVRMAYYAHASGGCLHVRPLINTKSEADRDKMHQISQFTLKLMYEYGGSFSSEHGDGRARSWLNEAFFGPELFQLFRDVKHTFDPKNLLNPGNVVDGQPLTDNLRFGNGYAPITLHETLDFSPDQGFHRAVEMCNGAGVCRKLSGTMCPPYMVTREEEHSTRGRANMLRAALTGKIPAERLTSPRMYETMDLCVSCKACKTECPSAVDMAKIKAEFLYQYQAKNGVTLRTRLFANIHRLNWLFSGRLAPPANWMMKQRIVKWANGRFLGIAPTRTLPPFARHPVRAGTASVRAGQAGQIASRAANQQPRLPRPNDQSSTASVRAGQAGKTASRAANHQPRLSRPNDQPRVLLFTDTFNSYSDPHIARAATELLEAAGFEVLLPPRFCCGRPALSKGLLNQARQLASDTVSKLLPFAEAGIPIIGLEPSCLLSLRDDYHYLLPPDQREPLNIVAEKSLLFEEFIAQQAEAGELNLTFKPELQERPLLLHGHCHQKALVGTETAVKILSLPGYVVTEVDSGCCGMAGSFGYEAEHVEISLKMGERALFPAVRAVAADTPIAAAGTSCRHQIADGTGRRAQHPAEILRDALLQG